MAISFPTNPTINQTYTYLATTYVYDGKRWSPTATINSLSPNTVTTASIIDGAVTASKLASGAGMDKAVVTGYNLVFGG